MPSGYLYEARTFKIAGLKPVGGSLVGSLVATGLSGPLERVPPRYINFVFTVFSDYAFRIIRDIQQLINICYAASTAGFEGRTGMI